MTGVGSSTDDNGSLMGQRYWMGHGGHGSELVTQRPITISVAKRNVQL